MEDLLESLTEAKTLSCDMSDKCEKDVTHIDHKGWTYCAGHAAQRKSGGIRCRKLKPAEKRKLEGGGTIKY
jgi:hypothetical protein